MLKKLNLQKKRQITKKKKSKVKKEHYKTLKLKPLSSKQIATQNEKKVKQKKQPNKRDTKKNICLIGPIASGKTTCASVINTDGYFVVPLNALYASLFDSLNLDDLSELNMNLHIDDHIVNIVSQLDEQITMPIVFDGFPQNLNQLSKFVEAGGHIERVFYLDASFETLYARAYERLVCPNPNCSLVTNRYNANVVDGFLTCPICNSALTVRADDNLFSLDSRYNEFYDYLGEIELGCNVLDIPFIKVDAEKDPMNVCKDIIGRLQ